MKPLWKHVFDTVEQAAAPVMANATASNGFAEIMRVGIKISRDMNTQAEAISRQWLHALNLPAAGDLAYLKTQVGSLEAEVRSLRRALDAQTATLMGSSSPVATATARKAPAKRASGKKPAVKRTTTKAASNKNLSVVS